MALSVLEITVAAAADMSRAVFLWSRLFQLLAVEALPAWRLYDEMSGCFQIPVSLVTEDRASGVGESDGLNPTHTHIVVTSAALMEAVFMASTSIYRTSEVQGMPCRAQPTQSPRVAQT